MENEVKIETAAEETVAVVEPAAEPTGVNALIAKITPFIKTLDRKKIIIIAVAIVAVAAIIIGAVAIVNGVRCNKVKEQLAGKSFMFSEVSSSVTSKLASYRFDKDAVCTHYSWFYTNGDEKEYEYKWQYDIKFKKGKVYLVNGPTELVVCYNEYDEDKIDSLYHSVYDEMYK